MSEAANVYSYVLVLEFELNSLKCAQLRSVCMIFILTLFFVAFGKHKGLILSVFPAKDFSCFIGEKK